MATKKDFEINRRVSIAIDALSPNQKAAITPVLESRKLFVAQANRPGSTKKLPGSSSAYSMKAGGGMQIIFTREDGHIVVQDIMRKTMMDQLFATRKSRPAKKTPTPTTAK